MLIVRDLPPNFEQIAAVFPEVRKMLNPRDPEVVHFAWGRVIYNPSGHSISQQIHEHEKVHSRQQLGDEAYFAPANPNRDQDESGREDTSIREWWARYLVDVHFRLVQEWPAHLVELAAYRKRHGEPGKRAKYLDYVAVKLSGPLYGGIITFRDARDALVVGRLARCEENAAKVGANGESSTSLSQQGLRIPG